MQPFRNFQVFGWAALPNIPCHGPAHFVALKNHFVLMLCIYLTTFKSTAGRAPPNTVQLISRCRKQFLVWMVWSFSKTFDLMTGPCSPKHGPVPFKVLKNFFVWMLCTRLKPFKFIAWPRSPTSPVTAQLISRRERCFLFWSFADFQQRLNEWLVVLPETRSSSFHGVKAFSRLDEMKVFKIIQSFGLAVLPQTQPSSFHSLEELFRPDVMHPFKTIQVCGWAVLPNIPCHVPAHFPALKNHFVLMLCRLSTTFKWTAGRASQNTIQLISRCQTIFSFGW